MSSLKKSLKSIFDRRCNLWKYYSNTPTAPLKGRISYGLIIWHPSFYSLHFLWERHPASKIVVGSHSHSNNEKICKGKRYLFPKIINYFHTNY